MQVTIIEKKYGNRVVLKNIHLAFPKGQATLIIGTSGAGKSTLVKCIIRQTSFSGSSKGYKGEDIAYIPQHPALNRNETARDAVYWSARFSNLFATKKQLHSLAQDYIEKVGLSAVQEHKIKNLSGGQTQRVSIAKELIRGKSIIIADEIDTGLDCGVAQGLIKTLKRITQEESKTTIVISHNLTNIELYDNVVVLAKDSHGIGRVAYAGTPEGAKKHFEVNDYVDILTSINTNEESGLGLADIFISKYETII